MKTYLVLDKNYLQFLKNDDLLFFARGKDIIMPSSLAYEITKATDRRASFYFRLTRFRSVRYTPNLAVIIKDEIRHHRPWGIPSKAGKRVKKAVLTRYADANYEISQKELRALSEVKLNTDKDAENFITTARDSLAVLQNLGRAGKSLTNDRDLIIDTYEHLSFRQFELLGFEKPPSDILTESWAIYRWIQAMNLFMSDIGKRYPSEPLHPTSKEKINHDTLDLEYLVIAALEGTFATNEVKLAKWFKLMRPDGKLTTALSDEQISIR